MTITEKKLIKFQADLEEIRSELDITKDLQMIVIEKVDKTDISEYEAKRIYFQMNTFGFVIYDRMERLLEKTDKLVEQLYGRE